jgi:hypothetical protein
MVLYVTVTFQIVTTSRLTPETQSRDGRLAIYTVRQHLSVNADLRSRTPQSLRKAGFQAALAGRTPKRPGTVRPRGVADCYPNDAGR